MQTDIYYPAQLPNALREGHALKPASPFSRTELASGRARQRREFSSVPVFGTWDFLFTGSQAQLFESWFAADASLGGISDGVSWFNIPRKTPMGMRLLVCRFTSMYSGPTLTGLDRWRYSCPLEIYERDLLPAEWVEFPEFVMGMDIFDIAMNKEWSRYANI